MLRLLRVQQQHDIAQARLLAISDERDLQLRGSQWLPGKILDTFAPCGPVLVTIQYKVDIESRQAFLGAIAALGSIPAEDNFLPAVSSYREESLFIQLVLLAVVCVIGGFFVLPRGRSEEGKKE